MIIKHKNDLIPAAWSGGTTTELYVFPEDSSYANRDFLFRISTSTVDNEYSRFTTLQGVKRHIMLLNGEMELIHDDQPPVKLARLQPHIFDGGATTISSGRCTDFNLMTRENAEGNISGHAFRVDAVFEVDQQFDFVFIYLIKGNLSDHTGKLHMREGDFLFYTKGEKVIFNVSGGSELILSTIKNIIV